MPVTRTHLTDPDPASPLCRNCEHLLSEHVVTGSANGPNATDSLRCSICGTASGTHYAGWREGLTRPNRLTKVVE